MAHHTSMDIAREIQNMPWCKPDWSIPTIDNRTKDLLQQCQNLPRIEVFDSIHELVRKSKDFPIEFPIETVRLDKLMEWRPRDRLHRNIASTYPIVHERVLILMARFLLYKREYGSSIEKAFYRDMTIPELIDRILQKRAVMFMGEDDYYKLLTGEVGSDGWESVGTLRQSAPLVLESCLSYDEMKISAMVYVSGHTECINDGSRFNRGLVSEKQIETDAVIIGIIGARFEREDRMDYEDILSTDMQSYVDPGVGDRMTSRRDPARAAAVKAFHIARAKWKELWAEFYQIETRPIRELWSIVAKQNNSIHRRHLERYIRLPNIRGSRDVIFDNEVYSKRMSIVAESVLIEADARGRHQGVGAFVNVIGAGLGVWKISAHQSDVYILTFTERVLALLEQGRLDHVVDVNFAYLRPSESVAELFSQTSKPDGKPSSVRKIFFESKRHPNGGINVQMENRDPSSKLTGGHSGKLLVMTYAWDGNAHPGNEFWVGSLDGSGDPAAACSTQVAELHNAHINPHVSAQKTRVLGRHGVEGLWEYCAE